MKVMVVGAGEVGFHIADLLCREHHEVTVIEKDRQYAAQLRSRLNAFVVEGSGASTEVLEEARVADMDLFVAVTDLDEVNLVACLLAHDQGVPQIIARIKSQEYTKADWSHNAARLGIKLIINPQTVVAEEICRSISYTEASEVAEFAHGRVVFLGYPISAQSPLAGVSMRTLGEIRGLYRMVVTAISRAGRTITPHGDDEVQPGDTFYFVCTKRDLAAVTTLFGFEERQTKSIFVLGGGRIGSEVAARLAKQKYRVKIVERDPADCEVLAATLEGVQVLNTKGTDFDTLKNEGLERADVFIAVTEDDESNILCSLLAKRHGVRRAIALVDRHELLGLASTLGVDVCVSPRLATASAILRYVWQAEVVSMAMVEQCNSEVIEFSLPADSPILHQPLKTLDIPAGCVVGAIVRGDDAIVPFGEDHFEAGDHVVVFSLPEVASEVVKFFS